jgi:hypothetical protein
MAMEAMMAITPKETPTPMAAWAPGLRPLSLGEEVPVEVVVGAAVEAAVGTVVGEVVGTVDGAVVGGGVEEALWMGKGASAKA